MTYFSARYRNRLHPDRLPANVRPHMDNLLPSGYTWSAGYHQPLVQDFVLHASSALVANGHHRPDTWCCLSTRLHIADLGCLVCDHENPDDIRQLLSSWKSQSNVRQSCTGGARSSATLEPCGTTRYLSLDP